MFREKEDMFSSSSKILISKHDPRDSTSNHGRCHSSDFLPRTNEQIYAATSKYQKHPSS